MKKKRMLFLAMSCFIWTCATQAQVNLNNTNAERDNEDETEEIEEIDEDEIAVTDSEGNEELIEFPEAMTYDLDSLLNL